MFKAKKAFITIFTKYSDYIEVFLSKLITKLSEYIGIKNHVIQLKNDNRPFYGSIYSIVSMELELLKDYIKINLANNFIRPFKSLVRTPMFFDYNPNKIFCFNDNYCSLNNLIIKNCYLLFSIGKLYNYLR